MIELKIKHKIYGTMVYIVSIDSSFISKFINDKTLDQKILCKAYKCSTDVNIRQRNVKNP